MPLTWNLTEHDFSQKQKLITVIDHPDAGMSWSSWRVCVFTDGPEYLSLPYISVKLGVVQQISGLHHYVIHTYGSMCHSSVKCHRSIISPQLILPHWSYLNFINWRKKLACHRDVYNKYRWQKCPSQTSTQATRFKPGRVKSLINQS